MKSLGRKLKAGIKGFAKAYRPTRYEAGGKQVRCTHCQGEPAAGTESTVPAPLPLENGDTLSSREFLRRYDAMPQVKKAELIEGVVYMGSPVSRIHARPDGIVQLWLGYFASHTSTVEHLSNATVILDAENTIQADALLRLLPDFGGGTLENEKHLITGPPELIVEIAASSASIDLHDKFRACQRNGVLEYLVWVVAANEFKWFALEEERYVELTANADGLIASRMFPTLVLARKALLSLDSAAVLAALESSLKSPAHTAFLEKTRPVK